jgi:rhamnosyltransferase
VLIVKNQSLLELPELFDNFWLPYFSRRQRTAILKAAKAGSLDLDYQPNLAVMVRTKNDRPGLERIIGHISEERKNYKGRIDLIVVDTESTDGTVELAKKSGATVVPIPQSEFNYPKSINLGLQAVKPDVEAAFITVGHAQLAARNALQSAARHLKDSKVVAVYADQVPHQNATRLEKSLYYFVFNIYRRLKKGAHPTPRPHAGLTQGTGTLVRMKAWRQHKFDEAYGHGGEDLAWGKWALKAGHRLIYDPAAAVHHTHGLGFINFARQVKYWLYIAIRKGDFKQEKIAKYRPDLFK